MSLLVPLRTGCCLELYRWLNQSDPSRSEIQDSIHPQDLTGDDAESESDRTGNDGRQSDVSCYLCPYWMPNTGSCSELSGDGGVLEGSGVSVGSATAERDSEGTVHHESYTNIIYYTY